MRYFFIALIMWFISFPVLSFESKRILTQKTVTPTLDTSAYATGDRLGSIQTVATGNIASNSVTLKTVIVLDKSSGSKEIDLLIFSSLPTIASADNTPINFTDTELLKFAGRVNIASGDYMASASNTFATTENINLDLSTDSSGSIYVVPVIRDTVTYAASDLIFIYIFENNFGGKS